MAKVGRPKNPPKVKEVLAGILPVNEIFSEEEVKMYKQLIEVYVADFDKEDLSSGDLDDIMDLAKSRLLEFRILKTVKDNPGAVLDISRALETIRKENSKLKESLSSRRKDRYNPNEYKGFSIVDLAVAFDDQKKIALDDKLKKFKIKEDEVIEKRKDYHGNRYDIDTTVKEETV
jgi:soluble cytochrome b562